MKEDAANLPFLSGYSRDIRFEGHHPGGEPAGPGAGHASKPHRDQFAEQHHQVWKTPDASGQPPDRQRAQDREDLLRKDHRQRQDGEAAV